jgi:predicted nuclease of predicted toxin-antitoxin system
VIVFDHNLPPSLAGFLSSLAEPADHVEPRGWKQFSDEAILDHLVAGHDCLLTKDRAMLRRPDIIAICQRRSLGLFFLPADNLSALATSILVLNHWKTMVDAADARPRPFYAVIPRRGQLRFERRPGLV